MTDAAVVAESLITPELFGVLFDRHARHLHVYFARRLGEEFADDLLGETFVIAFRRRHSYDLAKSHARPWLYGIAANVMAQHRRDEARRWRTQAALGPDLATSEHVDDILGRADAERHRASLAAALAKLAARDREVLLLIAWEDLSYEEVATVLGIPIGTVRSRLNRARRVVRQHLPDIAAANTLRPDPLMEMCS